jgi:electron transfer flavoprotein beta subunit
MMNIIVCIKQVPDPESPASAFEIDSEAKQVKLKGVPPVLNPFDENALEAALRIKGAHQSKITVISMGKTLAKPVLRKALAAGADEMFLLEDASFGDLDSYTTALILAAAIKKIGAYDIIFTGRQASDTDAGVVGSGIAELLGIPVITIARKVELNDGKLRVERALADGHEVVETSLPALVTVSNELGELRSIAMKELIAAQKMPMKTITAQELGIEPQSSKRATLLKLFIPKREVHCDIIGGGTPEEAGANLAIRLRESQLI